MNLLISFPSYRQEMTCRKSL